MVSLFIAAWSFYHVVAGLWLMFNGLVLTSKSWEDTRRAYGRLYTMCWCKSTSGFNLRSTWTSDWIIQVSQCMHAAWYIVMRSAAAGHDGKGPRAQWGSSMSGSSGICARTVGISLRNVFYLFVGLELILTSINWTATSRSNSINLNYHVSKITEKNRITQKHKHMYVNAGRCSSSKHQLLQFAYCCWSVMAAYHTAWCDCSMIFTRQRETHCLAVKLYTKHLGCGNTHGCDT